MAPTTQLVRSATIAILCAALLVACGGEQPGAPDAPSSAAPATSSSTSPSAPATSTDAIGPVRGTIMGSEVSLDAAEFDGDLAVFAGDSWGWNPSLLIFLFAEDATPPEGRVISVKASDGMEAGTPHVHYRWRNPETDEIDTEVAMEGYDLRIEFGNVEDGHISGSISFEIPGQETKVSGTFRARIKGA